MSAVYDEVVLQWDGEEHTVHPSYRMIQAIESQGISIIGLSNRLIQGEPPMSQVSFVIAHMLRSAGVKVKPEDVYDYVMTEADQDEIAWLCEAVVTAFTPRQKDQAKNAEAPGKAKKKASSKK